MIFGYLDPGTGSLILQAIVGGLAGIGVAYRAWRSRLRGGKKQPGPSGDEEISEDTVQPAES